MNGCVSCNIFNLVSWFCVVFSYYTKRRTTSEGMAADFRGLLEHVSYLCVTLELSEVGREEGDRSAFDARQSEAGAETRTQRLLSPECFGVYGRSSRRGHSNEAGPLLSRLVFLLSRSNKTRAHKRPAITHRLAGLVSLSWLRLQRVCTRVCISAPVYMCVCLRVAYLRL